MNSTPENESISQNASSSAPSFPLVGLGASAGGIQALQTFFANMPDQSGMAFVVIMHLSPDHESNLASILQQRTAMPVLQVTERTAVRPNHVYVIPPSKHLQLKNGHIEEDGHIELVEPQQAAGKRLAVDLFFRTLSATYGPRAIAVVLSGSDGDGAIGIKHIKEQGGLTIVQEPEEAEYDGMPRSALATGMVDWVLPVGQMPARLMDFQRNETRMHIPPEDLQSLADAQAEDRNSGGSPAIRKEANPGDEEALRDVLLFVRAQTGHDFIQYKRATILRRVARRLQVNLLEDIPTYLEFLRLHPAEVTSLINDLLISVTNFFRDWEAFAALETYIPQLFADKAAGGEVRVWVAGCATGEEAYSVAILLSEYAARLESPPTIQVFATDLDEDAIAVARAGVYTATIEVDVSGERMRHFFHKEDGRYRVKKELRERVLFSVHNLLKDSPFSRLDLVTCRNLLIYLKREAQEGVFDLFHFALRSSGLLFLGSAESVSDGHALFASADRQHHLFVRRATARTGWQLPPLPLAASDLRLSAPDVPALVSSFVSLEGPSARVTPPPRSASGGQQRSPYADLHLSVLEQFASPSLLVNAAYDIVHFSEHAGRFLQFAGMPSWNLLEVVHPALRVELRTALFRAGHQRIHVTTAPIPFEERIAPFVTVHVYPAPSADGTQEFLLVVFEAMPVPTEPPVPALLTLDAVTHHLEEQLQHSRQQLSATVEQYEASLEELKAANEEQQSLNEEMRSTTEELETNKEELQSTNEELTTVNQELKSRVEELSRANGDLQNLMAATEIGTIFLDKQLRVQRFTPHIRELFNIIPTDIGRPLAHITHRLNYDCFSEDAERVMDTLSRSEREVSNDGHSYIARMLPYRTPEDYIDGVVLTFIDITERKQAEEALRINEERMRGLKEAFQAVVNGASLEESLSIVARMVTEETAGTARTAFYIADPDGTCLHPIRGAGDMPASYLNKIDGFLIGKDSLACGLAVPTGNPILTSDVFEEPQWQPWLALAAEYDFRGCWSFPIKTRENKAVGTFAMYFRTAREAQPRDLALAEVVTQAAFVIISSHIEKQERIRAEKSLQTSEAEFRTISEAAPALVWICSATGTNIYFNERWYEYTGQTTEEAAGYGWTTTMHPDDAARILPYWERCQQSGEPYAGEVRYRRRDGAYRWHIFRALPRRNEAGTIEAWYGLSIDTEDAKRAEEEVEALNIRLQRAMTETHHRVKNNLQLISALIDMQHNTSAETVSREEFARLSAHVRALSVIHDILTQEAKSGSDQETLSVKFVLGRLIAELKQTIGDRSLVSALDDTRLVSKQTTTLCLVMNELVSNALKHGKGQTEIIFEANGNNATLTVCDDGPGFPAGFDANTAASTGLELVENIVRLDLHGQITYDNSPTGGAQITVTFPLTTTKN